MAAAQLHLQVGDVGGNRRAGLDAVAAASAGGAALVVLPELSDTGYVFRDLDEARRLSDHEATLAGWVEAAATHDVVVVGGFCERRGDALHNSAAVVDASGVRAVYRKAHLWDREPEVFTPGGEAPPVVDTPAGRVGVVVCYDLEFAEWVRMASTGAEVLAVPVNWPAGPRPPAERPLEVVLAQAGAAANRVVVVVADRCGAERGVGWTSGTVIVGPDGYPVAGPVLADAPDLLTAEVDLADTRSKRVGERNDRTGDRRGNLYR